MVVFWQWLALISAGLTWLMWAMITYTMFTSIEGGTTTPPWYRNIMVMGSVLTLLGLLGSVTT